MSTQNEFKEIKCRVCSEYFNMNCYVQHIQTAKHKSVYEKYFQNRIDFDLNCVYLNCMNRTVDEFLSNTVIDFTILVDHLLFQYTSILVDFKCMALYNDKDLGGENKNCVKPEFFHVQDEVVLTIFYIFSV